MMQAMNSARPDGKVGVVGVPHVPSDGRVCSSSRRACAAGRRPYIVPPYPMDPVFARTINPGRVFDLEIPLANVA